MFFRLLATMLFVAVSHAAYFNAGGYSFNIDTVDARGRAIYHARVDCRVSGNTAYINATADGYRTARETIYLNEHTKNYYKRVRMEDPTVWIRVRDKKGNIVNAYVNQNQFSSFDSRRYDFDVRVSETGFSEYTHLDVDVKVNHMMSFGERINVIGSGEHKKVEISVERRDMREFSNNIDVTIPRDEQLQETRTEKIQELQFMVLNDEETEIETPEGTVSNLELIREKIEQLKQLKR